MPDTFRSWFFISFLGGPIIWIFICGFILYSMIKEKLSPILYKIIKWQICLLTDYWLCKIKAEESIVKQQKDRLDYLTSLKVQYENNIEALKKYESYIPQKIQSKKFNLP